MPASHLNDLNTIIKNVELIHKLLIVKLIYIKQIKLI